MCMSEVLEVANIVAELIIKFIVTYILITLIFDIKEIRNDLRRINFWNSYIQEQEKKYEREKRNC